MRRGSIVKVMISCVGAAALIAAVSGRATVIAQGGTALSGVVSSQAEGKMEGVLVTARREGANFDVTVVSDAKGQYNFPRTRLQPGAYTVKMRAVGYDLADPGVVQVAAGKTAKLDLKLDKTKDITHQLTSAEWLLNIPGTDEQKAMVQRQMATCTYCHNLEPIVKSKHTAEQFVPVITRMQKYYPDGTTYGIYERRGRQKMGFPGEQAGAEKNPSWGFWPGVKKADLGAYLATINMSGDRSLQTEFKTLPRPKGKATRVIITQYDMPRKDTVAHDSDVDQQGRLWYNDQSAPFLGMFDSKTGMFEEFPLPEAKDKAFTGASDVQVDNDGNIWFAKIVDGNVNGHFGRLHKFDPKTKTLTPSKMPDNVSFQFLSIAPGPNSDRKIWAGMGEFYRVDPKTGEMDQRIAWSRNPELKATGKQHGYGYELAVDPTGTPWLMDYAADGITRVDVTTKQAKFFKTPTDDSSPRRGVFDTQGRLWFSEYTADKIGMFDTKLEKFTEYDPGIKYFSPYTASNPDRNGRVYAPSNTSDRIMRIDPKTGEILLYLMPTMDFDTKQMRIDPVTKTALLFANKRNARVVKVEALD